MALVTMSGMQVESISPPWHLHLSHSSLLEDSLPEDPVLPLFLKCTHSERPFTIKHDAQTVFGWFRWAGPLVSVRLNVDIGYEDAACVIQYWDEAHADLAKKMVPNIHLFTPRLKFTLHAYDPWNLYCTVSSLLTS